MFSLSQSLKNLALPHAREERTARREHILNILLVSAVFLSFFSFFSATGTYFYSLYKMRNYGGVPLPFLAIMGAIFSALLLLSKKGQAKVAAILFLGLYFLSASYTATIWGADVPEALLIFALVIVLAGILLGTRVAFVITGLISIVLFALTSYQEQGIVAVNTSWKLHVVHLGDAAVFSITLMVLFIVSWLYNREIEASFQKVLLSEEELKKERDSLEEKVVERTRQLRELQLEKMMQLYRFAEFGRIASGLFHELATPLTSTVLNLELLEQNLSDKKKSKHVLERVNKAQVNIQRIEQFVVAARKQIQKQESLEDFSLQKELSNVLQILFYKARKVQVTFRVEQPKKTIFLFGNSLKMNQVLTNIISNAIDAYDQKKVRGTSIVKITMSESDQKVKIMVQDWGAGITAKVQPHIFEPLFTTKSKEAGMGIGLSISKDIIEKDFQGQIDFHSQEDKGSSFTLILPPKAKKVVHRK